jgi:hypothetical protein
MNSSSQNHHGDGSIPDLISLPPPVGGLRINDDPASHQYQPKLPPGYNNNENLFLHTPTPTFSPRHASTSSQTGSIRSLKQERLTKPSSPTLNGDNLSTTSSNPPLSPNTHLNTPYQSSYAQTTHHPMAPGSPITQSGSSRFVRGQSSFSRLGSSISRAMGRGSFNRNRSSFVKSWSSQYVHGRVVPPTTTTTINKEDCTIPYPTRPFSVDYAPFWFLIGAFFVMFCAYSIVLNLLTSVYGTSASLAIGILYFFFVLSATAMPAINMVVFKNNTVHTIFAGSIGNSFMMFCSIFGYFPLLLVGAIVVGSTGGLVWVGYNSVLSVMARHIAEQAFLRHSRQRLHKRMKTTPDTQATNDDKIDQLLTQLQLDNGRINLSKLTDEQTKRIILTTVQTTSWLTSIGWMMNSLNSVFGGFISWQMLSSNSGGDTDPVAAARPVFILFTCFGVVANIIYYLAFKKTPISMFASNEQPLQVEQHDDNRVNDNLDIVDAINDEGVVVHHSKSGLFNSTDYDGMSFHVQTQQAPNLHTVVENDDEDEDDEGGENSKHAKAGSSAKYTHLDPRSGKVKLPIPGDYNSVAKEEGPIITLKANNNNPEKLSHNESSMTRYSMTISTTLSSSLSDSSAGSIMTSPVSPSAAPDVPLPTLKPNPFALLIRSLYMMKCMLSQRVVYLSLVSWFQMLFPITLAVSFFTAAAIKPTLGTHNVPLFMIIVYLVDALAALLLSKILKGFHSARWFGVFGTGLQLIFAVGIAIFPSSNWIDPLDPLNTTKAWSIALALGSIAGVSDAFMQTGTNAALGLVVEGSMLIRSGGFGLAQICKSSGSIVIFTMARVVSFKIQTIVVIVVVVVSFIFQLINWKFHLPLDIDLLLHQYNDFVKRQELALSESLLEKELDIENIGRNKDSNGTNLDDLNAIG